jgi:cytosine/adenosine deaminase-related metal-dependent hydrolase
LNRTRARQRQILLAGVAAFGSISAGKHADLVLLDGNPLQDIGHLRNIHAVFSSGAHYDREALDQLQAFARVQAQSTGSIFAFSGTPWPAR